MKRKRQINRPKGMIRLDPPITRAVACWVSQTFDAKIERKGITWLRVKGGFGGQNFREDWIADVPGVNISVHDYYWNGDTFGANYGTFENAIVQETKKALESGKVALEKQRAKLSEIANSVAILEKFIASL